jgi:dihydroorotate dehydrogenase
MIKFIYQTIVKPILFKFPADDVHHYFLEIGFYLSKQKEKNLKIFNFLFNYKNPILKQEVLGQSYKNPIGLAAGFDYDADLIGILSSIGFGYHSIGTVTYLPYQGNPKPMLGRLPKSKSLLVNKGFKSSGLKAVLDKIGNRVSSIPLGISIGSTNQPYKNIEGMIEDIYSSFEKILKENRFDYFELNISCPNLINVENLKDKFDQPLGFGMLLNRLSYLNFNKPLYIKMYAEKPPQETLTLCSVAERYRFVSGFIFSNLVKDRTNPNFDQSEIAQAGEGNFSGRPT